MEDWINQLDAWVIAVTFAATMVAFWFVGRWWGRRSRPPTAEDHATRFTDASMALLGLLLAFTFSMALNRYDDRREAAVAESNAMGDLYTCATLMPEPGRSRLQGVLAEHAKRRLEGRRRGALRTEPERVIQEALAAQAQATDIVAAVVAQGSPIAVPLVNSLNEVTSTHAAYLTAYRERLPGIVLALLLLGSAIPAFLMGQHDVASDVVRVSGPLCFGLLVTLVIYVTFDLNQPSGGLITVEQESLVHLIQSMGK